MKQFDFLKKSLIAASLLFSAASQAQIHPLAFTVNIGGTDYNNWYKDYVGLRFEVVSPAAIAGDKNYSTSNDGTTSASNWGGTVPPTLIDKQIIMPQAGDSLCNSAITVSMAGKVGFVYRGGGIEFGAKALACQNAGAIACVIVNNVGGGPVGMAAGSSGASVTIPVYMISKTDGDQMDSYYHSGQIPHVTITNWGQNLGDDLGFVPGGLAAWHNFAIPRAQLTGSANPYRGLDGAFIANYGSKPTTGVKLSTNINYTPTGGSATSVHTSTTSVLPTFTVADSIYAMFMASDYDLPSASGTGRYDITYTIASDSVDDYPYDNSATTSFYATDSLFSKGRYDFTAMEPISTIYSSYNAGAEYIWGPMYYVNNAGSSISKIQYSLAMNAPTGGGTVNLAGTNQVYVFKWQDGDTASDGTIYPLDSIMQNGELTLVSLGIYNFGLPSDTSRGQLTMNSTGTSNVLGDTDGNIPHQVVLEANSWYYIGVDILPPSTTDPVFLGCDGLMSPYPRVFGRFHATDIIDYSNNVQAGTKDDIYAGAIYGNPPHPNTAVSYVNSVDSFNFANAVGTVPSVAMTVKPTVPDAVVSVKKPIANVALFPNPAKDYMTVSIEMEKSAKKVSYAIIDGLGRFVSRVNHENVQNEKTDLDVRSLAPGNYYLIISVDDKIMSRKFTIAK